MTLFYLRKLAPSVELLAETGPTPLPPERQRLLPLLRRIAAALPAGADLTVECITHRFTPGSKEVLQRLNDYQPVDPSEYYMALTPSFDAPEGPHGWLSTAVFIGKADRREKRSVFTYWMVL